MLLLHLKRTEVGHPPVTAAEHQAAAVEEIVFKYFAWFTLLMLPLYALLSWGLLRRLRYNLVEHLLANAFMMSAVLLLQMLLPLLGWARGTAWLTPLYYLDSLLITIYQVWAFASLARSAYRLPGSLWRALVISLVGLVLNSFLINMVTLLIVRLKHSV